MPVFDACVGALAVFFTQPAQAIYTVLPHNGALLAFQFLGVLAITRSRTPRPVRLALFVTCMWAGLALECHLEPVASNFDAGHEALAPLAPLVQSPAMGGALAALNTLIVWGGMGLGLYGGIVEDEWAFAVKGLACLVARQAFGLATRLPVPPGYIRVGATGHRRPRPARASSTIRRATFSASRPWRESCGGAATTGARGPWRWSTHSRSSGSSRRRGTTPPTS